MKKKQTFLQVKIAEYLYLMRMNKSEFAIKIGFKRAQIDGTASGKIPLSKPLAKVLSKELNIPMNVLNTFNGKMPESLKKHCLYLAEEISIGMTKIEKCCEALKD